MAGYWPSSIFANLWMETKSIKTQNRMNQISYQMDLTSLVNKEFITWPKRELFLAGQTRKIPCGQDGSFSPARVANQNTRFARRISHGYITQ